jgi:hypothetical protein
MIRLLYLLQFMLETDLHKIRVLDLKNLPQSLTPRAYIIWTARTFHQRRSPYETVMHVHR